MEIGDQMNIRVEEYLARGKQRSIDVFGGSSLYGSGADIKGIGGMMANQSFNDRGSYPPSGTKISIDRQNDGPTTWCEINNMSRTPSRDSIFSHDGSLTAADDKKYQSPYVNGKVVDKGPRHGEDSVEVTTNQLVYLSTDSGRNSNSNSPSTTGPFGPGASYRTTSTKSLSLPGTPPSPPILELKRKNSMGNHDLKRVWESAQTDRSNDHDPVDLSCKRQRSEDIPPRTASYKYDVNRKTSDPGSMVPPNSILGAVLRGRSATFSSLSVVSNNCTSILETALRGRSSTFSGERPSVSLDRYRNLARSVSGSNDSLSALPPSRVQLSKRNLNPVNSRVLDRINAMTSFALNLPEFIALPINDQRTLLVGAAHRLLLLFMAEANLEFVVTAVHCDDLASPSAETGCDPGGKLPGGPVVEAAKHKLSNASDMPRPRFEAPTKQFVEGLQNFISKCQAINIRPSEYFYMRWIVLFHASKRLLLITLNDCFECFSICHMRLLN